MFYIHYLRNSITKMRKNFYGPSPETSGPALNVLPAAQKRQGLKHICCRCLLFRQTMSQSNLHFTENNFFIPVAKKQTNKTGAFIKIQSSSINIGPDTLNLIEKKIGNRSEFLGTRKTF